MINRLFLVNSLFNSGWNASHNRTVGPYKNIWLLLTSLLDRERVTAQSVQEELTKPVMLFMIFSTLLT